MPGPVDFIGDNTATQCGYLAKVAQLAERRTRNAQVPGSIPGLGLKAIPGFGFWRFPALA